MFQYGFMKNALIISIFISILCPCIGLFLVLKRHSMIGDTLAHSSLAGIALGLVIDKNPIITSFVFTSFSGLLIEFLRTYFKKYSDLILTIVLSLSVGIAITLISSGLTNANVNSFLFGSILTVSNKDVLTVAILSFICMLLFIFLFNELLYTSFDEQGAKISGIKVKLINYLFAIIVAATVSISIRIVGVLVVSSIIALPVATALQLKKGFKTTLIYSILFSLFDVIISIFISYYINSAPGGIIALTSVVTLILVILLRHIQKN